MAQRLQAAESAQAVQWEHLTVHLTWDVDLKAWTSDWAEGRPHASIDGILDQIGALGWELVCVFPYIAVSFALTVHIDLDPRYWAPKAYQAVFKRPKTQGSPT